jgi:hypothetical protein
MWRFMRKSYILAVLVAVALTLLLWMAVSPLFEPRQRRSLAEGFLEALKKQELTVDNAILVFEKYKIGLSALYEVGRGGEILQGDIYFPIALVDYEFLSEEAVPRGLVTHSMEKWRKLVPEDPDIGARSFNAMKEDLKRKKPKDLKIDEANKTMSYYDENPDSYKLHYIVTVTNALGMSLKKNAYVRIRKNIISKDNEIVEFKY